MALLLVYTLSGLVVIMHWIVWVNFLLTYRSRVKSVYDINCTQHLHRPLVIHWKCLLLLAARSKGLHLFLYNVSYRPQGASCSILWGRTCLVLINMYGIFTGHKILANNTSVVCSINMSRYNRSGENSIKCYVGFLIVIYQMTNTGLTSLRGTARMCNLLRLWERNQNEIISSLRK